MNYLMLIQFTKRHLKSYMTYGWIEKIRKNLIIITRTEPHQYFVLHIANSLFKFKAFLP